MNKVLEEISKIGIVPVIALDHVEDAAPLAKALCKGGLAVAEVTEDFLVQRLHSVLLPLRNLSVLWLSSSQKC